MDGCVCVCVEGDGVMNYEWMESRNDRYQFRIDIYILVLSFSLARVRSRFESLECIR